MDTEKLDGKRKKKRLTEKERRFMKEMTKGKSQTDAAMIAYEVKDRANASRVGSQVAKRIEEAFPAMMERIVPDKLIAKAVKEALKADKTYYSKAKGEFVTEKDHMARLKAADMAARLKNRYPKEEMEHNHRFVVTLGDETEESEHVPIIVEQEGAKDEL